MFSPPPLLQLTHVRNMSKRIVLRTAGLVERLREASITFSNLEYNLDEVGHEFIASYNRCDLEDPKSLYDAENAFATHFAKLYNEEDEGMRAFNAYREFFQGMMHAMELARIESYVDNDHIPRVEFHSWLCDDLVVAFYRLPY